MQDGRALQYVPEKEKTEAKIPAEAIALMIKNPSLIKRPVFDFGNNSFLLGFDEKALQQMI